MPDETGITNDEIMTVAEIAGYLKVSEKTIFRMVQSGRLPGTKVSNQWRFLRPVIDDWLMARMQTATKENLAKVVRSGQNVQLLSRLVTPDRILMNLTPGPKRTVLEQLTVPLISSGIAEDGPVLLEALLDREDMMSTAVGHGVAMPHARDPEQTRVKEPCIVIGVCNTGTDYDSLDGEPTHVFTLICSDSETIHLRIMAEVSLLLRNRKTVDAIQNATSVDEVMALLLSADSDLESIQ